MEKIITFRELYAALILAVFLTLWGTIPYARNPNGFWVSVYNFNVNIASVLILLLQVAGLSRLFCCERAGRTDPLIRAGRFGLRDTFGAKLALGLSYGAASSLFPGLLAFCLNLLLGGGIPDSACIGTNISRIPLWETAGPLALWGWEMLFSLLGGLYAAGLVLLCSFRREISSVGLPWQEDFPFRTAGRSPIWVTLCWRGRAGRSWPCPPAGCASSSAPCPSPFFWWLWCCCSAPWPPT